MTTAGLTLGFCIIMAWMAGGLLVARWIGRWFDARESQDYDI